MNRRKIKSMVPAEYTDQNQLAELQIEKDNSSLAYETI